MMDWLKNAILGWSKAFKSQHPTDPVAHTMTTASSHTEICIPK